MALLRRESREGGDGSNYYWREVLNYAAGGNLQAVLDEFAHVLVEDLGVSGRPAGQIRKDVAAGMQEALQLRTATLAADEFIVDGEHCESGFGQDAVSNVVRNQIRRTSD